MYQKKKSSSKDIQKETINSKPGIESFIVLACPLFWTFYFPVWPQTESKTKLQFGPKQNAEDTASFFKWTLNSLGMIK